jgi:hypothetical protein
MRRLPPRQQGAHLPEPLPVRFRSMCDSDQRAYIRALMSQGYDTADIGGTLEVHEHKIWNLLGEGDAARNTVLQVAS